MPPHCDSLDGPVVTAAREAVTSGEVQRVAPYVPAEDEAELRRAFDLAVAARALGPAAREVADRWFFETAVRLHRAGEGAPFTGLKPAGGDVGPVIPAAEHALESGRPDQLGEVLCGIVRDQLQRRHTHAMALKERSGESVPRAREYVEAALGLQVWAHGLYRQALSEAHARADEGRHEA
ncbi:DUF6448 family protein [Actinomycetospora chibensis]